MPVASQPMCSVPLGKVRSRLNAIKGQGDPGPGARKLMQETLDGNSGEIGHELACVVVLGVDLGQRAHLGATQLAQLDPTAVLARGFSIVRDTEGREVIAPGQTLSDAQILQMNFLVEGVKGSLPR